MLKDSQVEQFNKIIAAHKNETDGKLLWQNVRQEIFNDDENAETFMLRFMRGIDLVVQPNLTNRMTYLNSKMYHIDSYHRYIKSTEKPFQEKYWWAIALFVGAVGWFADIGKEWMIRKLWPETNQSKPTTLILSDSDNRSISGIPYTFTKTR